MLRFAVASDFHSMPLREGKSGEPTTFLRVAAPAMPSKQDAGHALLDLIRERDLRADAFLVPGDLTDKAGPEGLVWADRVVSDIARELEARSCITLGNHDVDSRNSLSPDPLKSAKAVRQFFPAFDEESARMFWHKHYYIVEHEKWRIVVLNTASDHTNVDSAMRGSVSDETLEAIELDLAARGGKPVQIALMHHHPVIHSDIGMSQNDIMLNGDVVLERLAKCGTGLVIHGHKHRSRATQVMPSGHFLTVFAAGSFSAALQPSLASNVRNMFHLVEVENPIGPGRVTKGRLHTWQFSFAVGWQPATVSSAGVPHVSGFGAERTVSELAEDVVSGFSGQQENWEEVETRVPELCYMQANARSEFLQAIKVAGLNLFYTQAGVPALLYREQA